VKEVALSIGISVPTLRQHYSSELERRHAMVLMMESVQLGRLNDQAAAGNVAAEKELMKALEKGRLEQLSDRVARRDERPRPSRSARRKQAAKAKGIAASSLRRLRRIVAELRA
jgi:AcrR family transcriptional regulator